MCLMTGAPQLKVALQSWLGSSCPILGDGMLSQLEPTLACERRTCELPSPIIPCNAGETLIVPGSSWATQPLRVSASQWLPCKQKHPMLSGAAIAELGWNPLYDNVALSC